MNNENTLCIMDEFGSIYYGNKPHMLIAEENGLDTNHIYNCGYVINNSPVWEKRLPARKPIFSDPTSNIPKKNGYEITFCKRQSIGPGVYSCRNDNEEWFESH